MKSDCLWQISSCDDFNCYFLYVEEVLRDCLSKLTCKNLGMNCSLFTVIKIPNPIQQILDDNLVSQIIVFF